MLDSSELKDKVIELQRRFDGKKLLLGYDRMDYVKGIPHKLLALEKFLEANPQWSTQLVLVQIATPPKNDTWRYHKLRNKVHKPSLTLTLTLTPTPTPTATATLTLTLSLTLTLTRWPGMSSEPLVRRRSS